MNEVASIEKHKEITTLVGLLQAKIGHKFLFNEPTKECYYCDLSQVCIDNLEVGRVYKIVEVLGKKHNCDIHEGGVIAVKVVESEIEVAINAEKAFEGAIINFQMNECNEINCKNYELCNPIGLKNNEKCKILKLSYFIENCLKNYNLKKAIVKRVV
ncbi:MAG: UPF0179 family protein [Nitrososphaerota archaeon]